MEVENGGRRDSTVISYIFDTKSYWQGRERYNPDIYREELK